MTSSTTLVGCTFEGAQYHLTHCPERDVLECAAKHGAIFGDSESQCSAPTCDKCGEAITGTRIIHGECDDRCEYCGDLIPA